MCEFPDSLPATTPALSRARLIMQLMAAALVLVALIAILAQEFFFIVYALLLAYMLYVGWAKFDYIWTLYFFLICSFEAIMSYVWLIQLIQYYKEITGQDALRILLGVFRLFYFFNGVLFGHFCYKIFKAYAQNNQIGGSYELMPVSNPNLNGLASSQTERTRNVISDEVRSDGRFRPFQGTGVSIG